MSVNHMTHSIRDPLKQFAGRLMNRCQLFSSGRCSLCYAVLVKRDMFGFHKSKSDLKCYLMEI